ncbi:MAG: hypothetical protein K2K56_13510 [Lachnospiraceae bacterium]|nr:hypothetical protein [Lachnospiraceae bacterium]
MEPIRLVKFKNLPEDVQTKLKIQGVSEYTVFSLDNRRLYAAKQALVKINSRWATEEELLEINLLDRFSTVTAGKSINLK